LSNAVKKWSMEQESSHKFGPGNDQKDQESVFRSDCYELKFWKYDSIPEQKSVSGYTDHFCITYVYSGNLRFDLFNRQYDLHTGHILIDKPRYEFCLPPAAGVSTVFRFYPDFYRQFLDDHNLNSDFFFSNLNLLSIMLASRPEVDYLHYEIIRNYLDGGRKLEMDGLVMDFLHHVLNILSNKDFSGGYNSALKKFHLPAIEMAKDYMHRNFSKDISLQEIATYACISMFHFSRVFKQATSFSPHQYLLNVRLKHAEVLLKTTSQPISVISAASGFKVPEYFATSFRLKFNMAPNAYRKDAPGALLKN
jgi:AraC family transcriptional regulator